MEIVIICIAAFLTAILTFFSGFGLGTILLPVFALFFPVEIAVALTGIVHFSNNIFKIALVGRKADKAVLLRFGLPAVPASFAGAWLLIRISNLPALHQYELFGNVFEIMPVKLTIAVILITFSFMELKHTGERIQLDRKHLPVGGLLSGFFGGLAGIQGAIRSAFLIRSGLSKESYIATGVIIAAVIDLTRLSVYATRFKASDLNENVILLISSVLAAITGAFIGSRLLKKVTLRFIQILVAVMLLLISVALGAGFI